jgi:hypothetical protein
VPAYSIGEHIVTNSTVFNAYLAKVVKAIPAGTCFTRERSKVRSLVRPPLTLFGHERFFNSGKTKHR